VLKSQSIVWLLLGGAAAYLYMGNAPFPPALWIAPVLLLHFAHGSPPVRGLAGIYSVLLIASVVANVGILPVQGPMYFGYMAGISLVYLLPYVADRFIASRFPNALGTLIFPLSQATVEYAISLASPASTWGITGYTQFGFLGLMQVASVTGMYGISFLTTWFSSVLAWAWDRSFTWKTIRTRGLTCLSVLTLVIIGGQWRLTSAPGTAKTFRAAALSYPPETFKPGEATRIRHGQVAPEERDSFREKMAGLQDWFLETSRREAQAGAKIVMLGELNLLTFKEDENAFLARARDLARTEEVYLLIGMATVTPGAQYPLENKAVFIDDSGRTICSYVKAHPADKWEDSPNQPDKPFVGDTRFGRSAVVICYDMDFPGFIRKAGAEHAVLMLAPANDWREIKQIHLAMAASRAIENGFTLIRATSTGYSAVVDPYGRILAATDGFVPGARVMNSEVPVGSSGTIYAQVGDVFAWMCVAALLMLIGWGLRRPDQSTIVNR